MNIRDSRRRSVTWIHGSSASPSVIHLQNTLISFDFRLYAMLCLIPCDPSVSPDQNPRAMTGMTWPPIAGIPHRGAAWGGHSEKPTPPPWPQPPQPLPPELTLAWAPAVDRITILHLPCLSLTFKLQKMAAQRRHFPPEPQLPQVFHLPPGPGHWRMHVGRSLYGLWRLWEPKFDPCPPGIVQEIWVFWIDCNLWLFSLTFC